MIIRRSEENDVVYITYENLEKTNLVVHGISTRAGGVSKDYLGSMNLSYTRGDEKSNVDENMRRIAAAIGFEPEKLAFIQLVNATKVLTLTEEDCAGECFPPENIREADGAVTNVPGVVLSITIADCVPVLFTDPVHKAVGLAHAGWRGTVGKISQIVMNQMQKEYGTCEKDLIVAIGPSICAECYEVSEDVAVEFRKNFSEKECMDILKPGNKSGKYQLDLWAANRQILLNAGVKAENIEMPGICTCCNHEFLFSHRASNGKRGNLRAFLALK